MRSVLVSVGLSLFLTACMSGGNGFGGAPSVEFIGEQPLAAPTRADLTATERPYILGPFDELSIGVFGVDDLADRTVQIDAAGLISFPLVGVVQAAGRTPGELSAEIAEKLRGSFIRDPQVTVNLEETVSQVVTVGGQVEKPGVFPVLGRMTLMRAVATAGGLTQFSKEREVVVFRTVQGQQLAGLYNLDAIRRGNYPDPEIYANDVVIVSDSESKRLLDGIFRSAPLLTPLVLLIR
ncbi:MAG: polysaccharide biosynthesis/export family protein [Pacificimonas sp.]|jgi:polysaccharide export outer membrane protein|nr:polysaccharide biosynthesis/export family protein [Pacificimonas sp.]